MMKMDNEVTAVEDKKEQMQFNGNQDKQDYYKINHLEHPRHPVMVMDPSASIQLPPADLYHVDYLDGRENENQQSGYSLEEQKEAPGIDVNSYHQPSAHVEQSYSYSSSSTASSSLSGGPTATAPPLSDHVQSMDQHYLPSTPTSTSTSTRRPSIHDDLFQHLRATLSAVSPEPSILSSGSSTPRASTFYSASTSTRPTTATTTTTHSTAATTPIRSISPGSFSPERKQRRTHPASASPSTSISNSLTSVIQKGSKAIITTTSNIDLNQAISLSLYLVVSLIALISLVSILVAGYGLTLADDLKTKIGILGRKVELRRKRMMIDMQEWIRVASEGYAASRHSPDVLMGQSHPNSSNRKRRASFPQASRKERTRGEQARRASVNISEALKSSVRACATIAYSRLPFSTSTPTSTSSSSSGSTSPTSSSSYSSRNDHHRQQSKSKSQSQAPSRPRSRHSSPNRYSHAHASSSSSSSSSDTASSDTAHGWNKLPPRPPLSVLIPGMVLAVILALVAFFKNNNNNKSGGSENKKKRDSAPRTRS